MFGEENGISDSGKIVLALVVVGVIIAAGAIALAVKDTDTGIKSDEDVARVITDKFNGYNSDGVTHQVVLFIDSSTNRTMSWDPAKTTKEYRHDTFYAKGSWIYEGSEPILNVKEISAIRWSY